MNTKKRIVVLLGMCLLLLQVSDAAKNRKWQDARLLKIGSVPNDKVFVAPIAGIWLAGRLPDQVYCWVEMGDIVYTLIPKKDKPLNFTVNGSIKLAVEGLKAYAIDDGGKEVEFKVVAKVAKPPTVTGNTEEKKD